MDTPPIQRLFELAIGSVDQIRDSDYTPECGEPLLQFILFYNFIYFYCFIIIYYLHIYQEVH